MAKIAIFRINYKSDFILTLQSDAGWMTPFCIKFWTGAPSQAYFAGWDGTTYTNCAYDPAEPTKLTVQFDDHHLPVGDLKFQIAYHFTVADFPNDTEDEVINPANITTEIDGQVYQVMLDFTGETAPEIQFSLPAYANEVARIENELQRQENELARQDAELQREQASAAAVQGAENVNAQLNGTILTVTNRNGVSTSKNVQGPQGIQGPQGETGATPVIEATASVDDNVGIPMVTVDSFGPAESRTFDFAFKNLKGAPGQDGAPGTTPDISASATIDSNVGIPSVAVSVTGTPEAPNMAFAFKNLKGQKGDTGAPGNYTKPADGIPLSDLDGNVASGIVYDVTANNSGATFASLSALLSSGSLSTLIPTSVRKGGMQIRFVQTSDNKYLQYMYDGTAVTGNPNPFLDVANWEKINLEEELNHIDTVVNGSTTTEEVTITTDQAGYIKLSNGEITNPTGSWKHTKLVPIDSFVSAAGFINHASVASIALYSSNSFDSYLGGFQSGLNDYETLTDLSSFTSQYPTAKYVAFSTDTSNTTFVCKYNNIVVVEGLEERVGSLEDTVGTIGTQVIENTESFEELTKKVSCSNKMLHVSFDDTINAFKDLIDNNRTSLFDSPFFGALKTLHDTYGVVFSCYCFYDMIDLKYVSKISTISTPSTTSVYYLSATDGTYTAGYYVYRNSQWVSYDESTMRGDYVLFSLADMTNTYATEFTAAKAWLKFGFHSLDGTVTLNSVSSSSAKDYYDNFIEEIVRITGTVETIDMVPRLQSFSGTVDVCRALRDCDCGCLGFLTADYSETSGGSGGQSVGYYLTSPAPVVLWNKGQWYDYQERLHFYPSSLRLDGMNASATETYLNKFLTVAKYGQSEMICMYCHENQMFINGSVGSNYTASLTKVAEWAVAHGYLFGYPMNRIRASF